MMLQSTEHRGIQVDRIKYNGRVMASGRFATEITYTSDRSCTFECKITSKIGIGADARVYTTEDILIDKKPVRRSSVLKIVKTKNLNMDVINILLDINHINLEQIYAFSSGPSDSFLLTCRLHETIHSCQEKYRSKGLIWLKEYFITACLEGISFLHKNARIIHCDIKEDNIMFDQANYTFKIIDFNNAQLLSNKHKLSIDVTRPKKPPRLYKNPTDWDENIDYWAFGCVLFNVYNGCHLTDHVMREFNDTKIQELHPVYNEPQQLKRNGRVLESKNTDHPNTGIIEYWRILEGSYNKYFGDEHGKEFDVLVGRIMMLTNIDGFSL